MMHRLENNEWVEVAEGDLRKGDIVRSDAIAPGVRCFVVTSDGREDVDGVPTLRWYSLDLAKMLNYIEYVRKARLAPL